MASHLSAQEVIKTLGLSPHPEKGYYRETLRDCHESNDSSPSTCIYYLLEGEAGLSNWHRVLNATEIYHYYAGAPLQLSLSWDDGKPTREIILGNDIAKVSNLCLSNLLLIFGRLIKVLNFVDLGPTPPNYYKAWRMAACKMLG